MPAGTQTLMKTNFAGSCPNKNATYNCKISCFEVEFYKDLLLFLGGISRFSLQVHSKIRTSLRHFCASVGRTKLPRALAHLLCVLSVSIAAAGNRFQ
ncbi:hypothetical protein CHX27_07960 [Flavobacterium aurantiibacter]|uniref:Uncharacterized protein n=1 Tax=Flavobacterium aurantiibacter TaxID=2023067 RepID=A0A255ZTH8_9FLAO|nr:hypothetical protein CHX27_07960 [Flavobacterium aurantiibacter]